MTVEILSINMLFAHAHVTYNITQNNAHNTSHTHTNNEKINERTQLIQIYIKQMKCVISGVQFRYI